MEINIDRIKSRFGNKVLKEDIVKVYNDFKRIDNVLKLRLGIEESIVKYFRCKLNIGLCRENINKINSEIRGYENDIRLLYREEFDELRSKRKLMGFLKRFNNDELDRICRMGCIRSDEVSEIKLERFRKERDNNNRNYNKLNLDGNVSMGSNSNIWR